MQLLKDAVMAANVLVLGLNSGRISALFNVDLSSMFQFTHTFSLSPRGCSFVTMLYWSRNVLNFFRAWYVSSKFLHWWCAMPMSWSSNAMSVPSA